MLKDSAPKLQTRKQPGTLKDNHLPLATGLKIPQLNPSPRTNWLTYSTGSPSASDTVRRSNGGVDCTTVEPRKLGWRPLEEPNEPGDTELLDTEESILPEEETAAPSGAKTPSPPPLTMILAFPAPEDAHSVLLSKGGPDAVTKQEPALPPTFSARPVLGSFQRFQRHSLLWCMCHRSLPLSQA